MSIYVSKISLAEKSLFRKTPLSFRTSQELMIPLNQAKNQKPKKVCKLNYKRIKNPDGSRLNGFIKIS